MTEKINNRRKRKKNKNKILILGIVIFVVIVIAGAALWFTAKAKEKKTEKASAKPKTVAINVDDKKQEQASNGGEQNTNNNNSAVDRSGYAVVPGEIVGSSQESAEKVVYLTLDDGPSENTPKVLEILDRYNAKATFFVTNINPSYLYLIKEAYDKGHTIGLHTYSHDYAAVYASVDAYFSDLEAIGQVVKEQIGYVPCFIRFPGGSSNTISANYTNGIMSVLVQEAQNRGYQYYDWNCSSGDGSVQPTDVLVANGTSGVNNNIVLLSHDANGKETTVEALPSIIEYYQSQGYTFKALDKQSFTAHHGVNN